MKFFFIEVPPGNIKNTTCTHYKNVGEKSKIEPTELQKKVLQSSLIRCNTLLIILENRVSIKTDYDLVLYTVIQFLPFNLSNERIYLYKKRFKWNEKFMIRLDLQTPSNSLDTFFVVNFKLPRQGFQKGFLHHIYECIIL